MKKHKVPRKVVKLDSLQQINFDAGGIDIGSSEMYVCVPEGRDEVSVQRYESYTRDLQEILKWLTKCGVKTVAMESTGIYWIPLYDVLSSGGIEVYLVDARKIKNVTGRKTDVLDCQWIQQLHTYGLLSNSFLLEGEIKKIRDIVRQRDNLLRTRAVHIQRMQKSMETMNLKLTNVISDITGATGLKIIREIINGERSPNKLSKYRDQNCKNSEEVIEKSLEGNYSMEQIFILKQELELFEYYTNKIEECDKYSEELYSSYSKKEGKRDDLKEKSGKKKKPNKNTPKYDLRGCLFEITGIDLTQLDGFNVVTAQSIISEIGTDMSKWKSEKHFCSWLGVSPNNRVSGGKVLNSKTKKTNNRANIALRMAAFGLSNSDSALGAYYRRIRARLGVPKAITATAHKLARIIYHMLKYKIEYKDLGANYYEEKYKARILKNIKKNAEKLGYELVPKEAA